MLQRADDVLSRLPSDFHGELLPEIREEFLKSEKTVVVFDDDPTGTQTCHDVTVLTVWSVSLLVKELKKRPSILFILTNSRSLSQQHAIALNVEIGKNLREAVALSGRNIVPISRSDSTLRGHFPAEVTAIANALQLQDAIWILIPAFIEGGRFTIDDVHYIVEHGDLVPVSDTPFAKDSVFGYANANLKKWVEEKSGGAISATRVISCSLNDIRLGGPDIVAEKLIASPEGSVVIANAVSHKDLEVLARAILKAEEKGKRFLYRSSATFVSIRAGIAPGKVIERLPKDIHATNGSLAVVGSYVPKTTIQLGQLLRQKKHETIEINVTSLFADSGMGVIPNNLAAQTDQWLKEGKDVIIYTSRKLREGVDSESNLKIHGTVSKFLVDIVRNLSVRPSFMIAKGGITSSDLASKGLSAESALIVGQAIPGVPVWQLDQRSKFPELVYVVFPGNVGDEMALVNVWNKFKSPA